MKSEVTNELITCQMDKTTQQTTITTTATILRPPCRKIGVSWYLLEQSFTSHMLLLTAITIYGLGRRC